MTDEYIYNSKPLSEYSSWDLIIIERALKDAEIRREEASKHHKFDKKNNKKAMEFPAPNPEFLKLKIAIEEEIRKRENATPTV